MHEEQFEKAISLLSDAEVFVIGLGTVSFRHLFQRCDEADPERVTLISQESMDYIDCFSRFSKKGRSHDDLSSGTGGSHILQRKGNFEGYRVISVTDHAFPHWKTG